MTATYDPPLRRDNGASILVELLRSAVKARIDDTTGAVLSGGLDSSTVVALAPRPLVTFTGYYADEGFDERHYAALVPNQAAHHDVLITPEDFVEHFDDMRAAMRPPWQGMGAFGQYMVARYASKHVASVVSGEGSDELFGGYARTLLAAGEPLPEGYEGYRPPHDYPVADLAAALQYDLDRLPDLLAVDDQMCGAFGLESRAPFTDPTIVEYGLSLPPTERVGKRHLRRVVRGYVPDPIIDRKDKMGFPIPLAKWAQEEPVRSFIEERIGFLPDPARPWDRSFWYALLERPA